MKKVIFLLTLTILITASVFAQTTINVAGLNCVNKWNHNPNQLFYAPDDPLNIAADLTTIGNYMNTNSVLVGNNNAFTGNNTFAGTSAFNGTATFTVQSYFNAPLVYKHTIDTANVTRTLTVADLASGYIATAQGSAITLKLPRCGQLDTAYGATQGTVIDFYIDNTAGTGGDSIAVNTGIVAAKQVNTFTAPATILQSVAASTTLGVGAFEIVFISTTGCILYRKQ